MHDSGFQRRWSIQVSTYLIIVIRHGRLGKDTSHGRRIIMVITAWAPE